MLGQDDADRLLATVPGADRAATRTPRTPVGNDDLELLAESLSGLGFLHRGGRAAASRSRPADRAADREAPRRGAARRRRRDRIGRGRGRGVARRVADSWSPKCRRAPADAAAREELKAKLADLRDDAELIGDADLVAQARSAALSGELDGGRQRRHLRCEAAVDAIAETARVADAARRSPRKRSGCSPPTPTGSTPSSSTSILTEAAEVLDTVVEHRAELDAQSRRSRGAAHGAPAFHTLKGSGRMVGLAELGELAWEVEKVHNRLLEEDRDVTPAVLAMIDVAEASFRGWVGALQRHGRRRRRSRGALRGDRTRRSANCRAAPSCRRRAGADARRDGRDGATPAATSPPQRKSPVREPIAAVASEPEPRAGGTVGAGGVADSRASSSIDGRPEPSLRRASDVRARRTASSVADRRTSRAGNAHRSYSPRCETGVAEVAARTARASADDVGAEQHRSHRPAGRRARSADADTGAEILEFAPVGEMPPAPDRRRRSRPPPDDVNVGDVTLSAELCARSSSTRPSRHVAHAAARTVAAAVRRAAGAVRGDGARKPHAVRHPSHRRLSADRADSRGAGAGADRAAAARRAAAADGAAGARRRDRRSRANA